MLTFIIHTLENNRFHVIFQSNTEIGTSNYHFGSDVTVEMWNDLAEKINERNDFFSSTILRSRCHS